MEGRKVEKEEKKEEKGVRTCVSIQWEKWAVRGERQGARQRHGGGGAAAVRRRHGGTADTLLQEGCAGMRVLHRGQSLTWGGWKGR